MDKKTIIAILLCAGILLSWPFLVKTFFPDKYKQLYAKKTTSCAKRCFQRNQ